MTIHKLYHLGISLEASVKYNKMRQPPAHKYADLTGKLPNPNYISTHKFFHSNYTDNRPPHLKQDNRLSAEARIVDVGVRLSDKQIADVINLCINLEIDAKRGINKPYYHQTEHAIIVNLLGQFLDAVILGRLTLTHE